VAGRGSEARGVPDPAHAGSAAAASFVHDREAVWLDGEPLRDDPASLSAVIDRFRPERVPDEAWHRIGDLVRAAVAATEPSGRYRAHTLLNCGTQLAYWADTVGQPMTPETLFDPETIDRFIVEGCAHLSLGSRQNYRAQLWRVGEAVLGQSIFPARPLSMGERPNPREPYCDDEITALVAWCRALPSERLRRNCLAVMALGLGAGLSSQEMIRALGTDVATDAEGVVIGVTGTRQRTVPVLERWEADVEGLASEVGKRPLVLPDRTKIRRYDLPNLIECSRRSGRDGAPKLSPLRLRVTWIVAHLSSGTPLPVIAQAAGTKYEHLAHYAGWAQVPDDQTARQLLRDPRLP